MSKELIVKPEFTGLAGMYEFNSVEYWGHILPDTPIRFYELCKQHQGVKLVAFPSLKRLADMTGKKQDEIITSYEFMTIWGFITYKSAEEIKKDSNQYTALEFLKSTILLDVECVEYLIDVVVKTRRVRPSKKKNFEGNLGLINEYLLKLKERKVKALKEMKRTEDFDKNRATFTAMRQFAKAYFQCLNASAKNAEAWFSDAEKEEFSKLDEEDQKFFLRDYIANYTRYSLHNFLTQKTTPHGNDTPHGNNKVSEDDNKFCGNETITGSEPNRSFNKSLIDQDNIDDVGEPVEVASSNGLPFEESFRNLPKGKNLSFEEKANIVLDQQTHLELEDFERLAEVDLRAVLVGLCYKVYPSKSVLNEYLNKVTKMTLEHSQTAAMVAYTLLKGNVLINNPAYVVKNHIIENPSVLHAKNIVDSYKRHTEKLNNKPKKTTQSNKRNSRNSLTVTDRNDPYYGKMFGKQESNQPGLVIPEVSSDEDEMPF